MKVLLVALVLLTWVGVSSPAFGVKNKANHPAKSSAKMVPEKKPVDKNKKIPINWTPSSIKDKTMYERFGAKMPGNGPAFTFFHFHF